MAHIKPPPVFEFHLWATILAYIMVRHGLRRVLSRLTVHRGISHSVPTGAVWGALTYLYYPTQWPLIRITMAVAVMLGFFSHLLLDEICSVDLRGARVNKAFGTAIKFWAPNPWTTLGIYLLLSYLSWRVIQQWPENSSVLTARIPAPRMPFSLPQHHPPCSGCRRPARTRRRDALLRARSRGRRPSPGGATVRRRIYETRGYRSYSRRSSMKRVAASTGCVNACSPVSHPAECIRSAHLLIRQELSEMRVSIRPVW